MGHSLASQADQWKRHDVCGELRVEPEMKTESIVASNLIFHANAEQMWALLDAENMSRCNEDIALLGHVDTQCDHALLRGTRWRI